MKGNWVRKGSALLLCCLLTGILPARASAAFQDVPANHWAETSVRRCAEMGFFQGKTATSFGLGQSMTRSAAVVVLDRFFGWEDADFELPYTDVPADAWYAGALRSAYTVGAVTGQNTVFRPADPITREELAVMLIRSLGYARVSGVAQDLPKTFTDIDRNLGYINMARDFGLVSGIREDTFAPDRTATREQVAVILMRLHDKLSAKAPAGMEIVSSVEEMAGMDMVAVRGATLTGSGTLQDQLSSRQVQEIRTAAGNREQLLYVSGRSGFLSKNADAAVENLVGAVTEAGYDGLVLEITEAAAQEQESLTAFMRTLQPALGEKKLVLVLPAPHEVEEDGVGEPCGYDYIALNACADQLVLRVEKPVTLANKFPVAPLEPLEEVYWGLAQLWNDGVKMADVSLMLTTEGVHYSGKSVRDRLTGREIQQKLESGWQYNYSDRYGCAYLEKPGANEAIWYLDGTAAKAHLQMMKLSGVGGLCMEAPANASAELLAAVK